MPDPTSAAALQFRGVEKQYGALRPLRIHDLRITAGSRAALVGFDLAAAEAFINLATGAVLPDRGEVACLGQSSAAIADSEAWLAFVERIGIVSSRIVLLEGMTIAQNLALPFDLEFDPIPATVLPRVRALAAETGISESLFGVVAGEADRSTRARVLLARALALDPEILLLEHPTAALKQEDVKPYAALLKQISGRRTLTMVALTADEKFAKSLGGRLLDWQPATGELKERRRWF
jgi:predicted ABC-type transport system involved in lysophospholipase L1 biosynthesis ATPase subunit